METNRSPRETHVWISRHLEAVPGQPVIHQVCQLAVAVLSMSRQRANGTPFKHQSPYFNAFPMKLQLAGFPRSAPANA